MNNFIEFLNKHGRFNKKIEIVKAKRPLVLCQFEPITSNKDLALMANYVISSNQVAYNEKQIKNLTLIATFENGDKPLMWEWKK